MVNHQGEVVVLQSVQPLTTDVRALGPGVVVLTDGPRERVSRLDVLPPPRVITCDRGQWPEFLRGSAAAVVTNDEFLLQEYAALRAGLGLPSVTPTALDSYLDKVVMKTCLQGVGLRVPTWVAFDEPVNADLVVPVALQLPVVAKPRVGSNSRGVRIIHNQAQWQDWARDKAGQSGWQLEEHIDAPMCFVDALVVAGVYTPVLVGRYLGPLLMGSDTTVLGASSVAAGDPLWSRAVALGRRVAETLGTNGRFATHLEFFDAGEDPVVMEVCARAPGALVSEMARVVSGHNLETAHLMVQAGRAAPTFATTGQHAAWMSLIARGGQKFQGPPDGMRTTLSLAHLSAPSSPGGRSVAALALLVAADVDGLRRDLDLCTRHNWFL